MAPAPATGGGATNPYAEFTNFTRTVDGRIRTRCLHCPPDAPEGKYCAWEFSLGDDDAEADVKT